MRSGWLTCDEAIFSEEDGLDNTEYISQNMKHCWLIHSKAAALAAI